MTSDLCCVKQKDWLREMAILYAPTHALWRAIEAKHLSKFIYKRPILDLGCGDGLFASSLLGKIDAGIDGNPDRVRLAKLTDAYDRVDIGDITHLPYSDSSFSTILSNSVLEHVDGLEKAISEVARVLERGGKFIFTAMTPKFEEWIPQGMEYAKKREEEMEILHLLTEKNWIKLLEKSHLKVVHAEQYLDFETFRFWNSLKLPPSFKPNRFHSLSLMLVSKTPKILINTYSDFVLRKYYSRPVPKCGVGILIVANR